MNSWLQSGRGGCGDAHGPVGGILGRFSAAHGGAFRWSPKCSRQELCSSRVLRSLYLPLSQSLPYLLPTPHPPSRSFYVNTLGKIWVSPAQPRSWILTHTLPFSPPERSLLPCSSSKFPLTYSSGSRCVFLFFCTVECWKASSVKPGLLQRISCPWVPAPGSVLQFLPACGQEGLKQFTGNCQFHSLYSSVCL